MQCKACSTRIDPGQSVCPNCGRTTGPTRARSAKAKSAGQGKAAGAGKAAAQQKAGAATKAGKLVAKAKAAVRAPVAKALDLELEDIADEMVDDTADEMVDDTADETSQLTQALQGNLGPKPSELRATLAVQPELLGEEFSLFSGKKSGVRYPTEVGEVDLLLVDDVGSLIVVMIPDPESPGDPVSAILQRIGWIRKHVAKGSQEVSGIVLLPPMPEDLSYAAAAVSGTVAFRTYQMSITFEDLEI